VVKRGQKSQSKKVPLDGYIAPSDPANVLQNVNPQPLALPDSQVKPVPSAPLRNVVAPPVAGPAAPVPPLVP
jgi:hypothetical protein